MKNFIRKNCGSKCTVIGDGIERCQLRSYKMLLEPTNKIDCSMLSTGCWSLATRIRRPISEM